MNFLFNQILENMILFKIKLKKIKENCWNKVILKHRNYFWNDNFLIHFTQIFMKNKPFINDLLIKTI
jgi:hypothetical protein